MLSYLIEAISSDFFRSVAFVVGVFVAVTSIYSARATAIKKQSADLIFAARDDDKFVSGLRCLRIRYETGNVRELAEDEHRSSQDAFDIRHVLNYFELVSVGVQAGIYNEKMLKKNYFGTLCAAHKHAKPLIERTRERHNRPTVYQEFEWLAERWQKSPLKTTAAGLMNRWFSL